MQTLQSWTSVLPTHIQNLVHTWQSNSSLLARRDNRSASDGSDDTQDAYNYDQMGRMFRQTTNLTVSREVNTLQSGTNQTYDGFGDLLTKYSNVASDLQVTGYTYNTATKPHRLSSVIIGGVVNDLFNPYDGNGSTPPYDAATGDDTFLDYDGQNNVTRITVGTTASTTTPKASDEFWYSPDGDRFLGKETWNDNGTMRTGITTYLGAFEEVKPSAESGYNLFRRVQVTPTVMFKWRSVSSGATPTDWVYQHRDHLGSMDAMTDGTGALLSSVVGKTSFDPFGGRRSKDWSKDITPAELQVLLFVDYKDEKSPRGFADHEMLNRMGFTHMNGRVYDPRIGRFVSADPIVQEPTFSQSYNRYAYVMNNPVSYTDPSGFAKASIGSSEKDSRRLFDNGSGGHFQFDKGAMEEVVVTALRDSRRTQDAIADYRLLNTQNRVQGSDPDGLPECGDSICSEPEIIVSAKRDGKSRHDRAVEVGRFVATETVSGLLDEVVAPRGTTVGPFVGIGDEILDQSALEVKNPGSMVGTYAGGAASVVVLAPVTITGVAALSATSIGAGFGVSWVVESNYEHLTPQQEPVRSEN